MDKMEGSNDEVMDKAAVVAVEAVPTEQGDEGEGFAEFGEAELEKEMQAQAELGRNIQQLLGSMQSQFQQVSGSMLGKIDEMSSRIDELETTIKALLESQGVHNADTLIQSIREECGITEQDLEHNTPEQFSQQVLAQLNQEQN
eukprot:TRINITY_DN2914_c0_g1_i1.p1 TRINITY_DN2914_c0_g1~~TRINITY_DN2914_c0_g1_i1.p1  ORF type:complete len:144 (+),score=55.92 TRINITY_DN2914_c0_g1_i1:22-453(+)